MSLRILGYGGVLWLLIWLSAGCTMKYQPVNLNGKAGPDLKATPFFPQKAYQCGPASLAMVLGASGVDVRPETLVPLTYVPGKKGSFQLELLAAARTSGRIPYVIEPNLHALAAELTAGRPVLVLQNYGLDKLPSYHYAVVIGLKGDGEIILRSGTTKRHIMSAPLFLMSWLRPGGWGMVVLQPGELPENADRKRYIQALATFEKIHDPDTAQAGYRAAVRRWPQDPLLLFSAGNNALKRNDLARAEEYYQKVLKNAPEHLAAMNNLAHTLALRGCFDSAQKTIRRAVVLAEQKKTVFTALIKRTEKEIQELSRGSGK